MAKKISELPVNFPYEGNERLLMVQDGRTRAGFLSAFTAYLSDELLTDSELATLSGVWQSTYTIVSANSASWSEQADLTELQAASGSWDYTTTFVQDNSATWESDLNVVSEFQASSGVWESTYTTVSANSASWGVDTIYDDTPVTELQAASGDWDSTYTTVSANSASWTGGGGGSSGTSLSITTFNNTQTEIFVDGVASSRMTIATNTTWMFSAMVAARSATESAGYKIEGVIKNDGGTTSLVGTAVKTVFAEEDATWDITVEADDTNDALVFKVTGDSVDSVIWEVTVNKTEAS